MRPVEPAQAVGTAFAGLTAQARGAIRTVAPGMACSARETVQAVTAISARSAHRTTLAGPTVQAIAPRRTGRAVPSVTTRRTVAPVDAIASRSAHRPRRTTLALGAAQTAHQGRQLAPQGRQHRLAQRLGDIGHRNGRRVLAVPAVTARPPHGATLARRAGGTAQGIVAPEIVQQFLDKTQRERRRDSRVHETSREAPLWRRASRCITAAVSSSICRWAGLGCGGCSTGVSRGTMLLER